MDCLSCKTEMPWVPAAVELDMEDPCIVFLTMTCPGCGKAHIGVVTDEDFDAEDEDRYSLRHEELNAQLQQEADDRSLIQYVALDLQHRVKTLRTHADGATRDKEAWRMRVEADGLEALVAVLEGVVGSVYEAEADTEAVSEVPS